MDENGASICHADFFYVCRAVKKDMGLGNVKISTIGLYKHSTYG
jgi:hypothetical protein